MCFCQGQGSRTRKIQGNPLFVPYLSDYYMDFNVFCTYYIFFKGVNEIVKFFFTMIKGHVFLSRSKKTTEKSSKKSRIFP